MKATLVRGPLSAKRRGDLSELKLAAIGFSDRTTTRIFLAFRFSAI